MRDEQWFSNLRDVVEPLGSRGIDVLQFLPARIFNEEVLSFGYRIGLFTVADAVRIALLRLEEGIELTPAEKAIAFSFEKDNREVGISLLDIPLDRFPLTERRCRFLVVCLIRDAWGEIPDAELELQSFLVSWQGTVSFGLAELTPRGFDSLWFGSRARQRFLGRLDNAIAFERAEVLFD
ncbi:hypothetical protein [Rhodoglobus aureus]|uniref:Uncharacterized protein n=1 Tax=Rhodoglobus aureus TaxID=191497 RepID=A0ABN1VM83_9MICO